MQQRKIDNHITETTAEQVYTKAGNIRDVLRYLKKFKNSRIVIQLDDKVIYSPSFPSIIKDICYIHETGIKILIVPGAKNRIDEVLTSSNISWKTHNGIRITDPEEMSLIKMAAFDTANITMTALAGEGKTALIGNWVKARAKGIINGVNYGSSGEIERLNISAIERVLEENFIPIFPCVGWNSTGIAYNILSTSLATELAIRLSSEKLFFVTSDMLISNTSAETIADSKIPIPAMDLTEVKLYISQLKKIRNVSRETNQAKDSLTCNLKLQLLTKAYNACLQGVTRVHIINGSLDGALPCEIFSGIGSGTMIYKSDYGGIRNMQTNDIPDVLNLMRPFIEKGILLYRNAETISSQLNDYIVFEMDGGIKACASLHIYKDMQAEIAAIAVDKSIFHLGTGPKLVNYLIARAKEKNCSSVFVLTTQTADWFLQLGFNEDSIESLPLERKNKWTPQRGSKVFRISFK
ncbi:MAG: amino-acid N-acetyltransferase [Treponema sp. CETP13]|nr:MAG: amino-acid N-acetyltransferase [Treponema sp. CETP13]